MQTHDDRDAGSGIGAIEKEAERMTKEQLNELTAGKPGEASVEQSVGQFFIVQRPDDKFALRISIGEVNDVKSWFGDPDCYLVFRGNPRDIEELLARALAAFRASHFESLGSQL